MANHYPLVSWANNAVLYEANIRQFTTEGTFTAFAQHLPRLKAMGIDIIWLMPVTPISKKIRQGTLGSYYACSSYTQVNTEFGTIEDLKNFVLKAHESGLKIIIDWVANHTGWDHEWATKHPDWYIQDAEGNFTERNGWHDVIDLNFEEKAMRKALIEAMKFWIIECDIDGFRCDMAHLVPLDFWQDARQQCDAVKPLFWLAECEVVEYHNVFDVSYAWAWMHETEKYFRQEARISNLYNILHSYSQYPQGTNKLLFTTNHDENSWNGTEYEKYGICAKALAVFSFTWKGMPLIYSGQESPNKKRIRFFDKDLIEWNTPLQLENFYTTLSSIHKTNAIILGETFILPTTQDYIMAYLRKYKNEVTLVVLNLSHHDRVNVSITHDWLKGNFTNCFSELSYPFNTTENFELMAGDYLVYQNF